MKNQDKLLKKEKFSIAIKIVSKAPFIGRKIKERYFAYRNKKILNKLYPLLDDTYKTWLNDKKINQTVTSPYIWFFWWQGVDKMPPLSQKCYRSLSKNKGKRKIIFISKYNVKKYAKLPDYIYSKVNDGRISLTHFSDILRFNLLRQYGGLWVDATMYFTDSLDKYDTANKLFTCSGYIDKANISEGRWTGFFIGGPAKSFIFVFMDEFFKRYWRYNSALIDYFLIDFALYFAWKKNIDNFRMVCKNNEKIAPNMFKLQKLLNNTFSKSEWEELTQNTSAFKLSNRGILKYKEESYFSYL